MALNREHQFERKTEELTRKEAVELGIVDDFQDSGISEIIARMNFPFPVAMTYPASCLASLCSTNKYPDGALAVLRQLRLKINECDARGKIFFDVPHKDPKEPPVEFKSVSEFDEYGARVLTVTTLGEGDRLSG